MFFKENGTFDRKKKCGCSPTRVQCWHYASSCIGKYWPTIKGDITWDVAILRRTNLWKNILKNFLEALNNPMPCIHFHPENPFIFCVGYIPNMSCQKHTKSLRKNLYQIFQHLSSVRTFLGPYSSSRY